jgi:hypothetical protein
MNRNQPDILDTHKMSLITNSILFITFVIGNGAAAIYGLFKR